MIRPKKYLIEKTDGEEVLTDEYTKVPAHEREKITPYYENSQLIELVEDIKTVLIEEGMSEAFDRIKEIKKKIE